jgi:hypothetical protein
MNSLTERAGIDVWMTSRLRRVRAVGDQERVAVAGPLGDEIGADRAARAGPVVEHERLAHRLGEALREGAPEELDRTAGRKRHDEPQRSIGIGNFRCSLGRDRQEVRRNDRQSQGAARR